jgi:2-dehydropantoate 2-reductase
MGVQIEPQDIDQVWKIAQITAQNRNSMLGDLEAGRITEVGWLNGAVARLGNEFGIATPENQNLFSLISALENSRGKG